VLCNVGTLRRLLPSLLCDILRKFSRIPDSATPLDAGGRSSARPGLRNHSGRWFAGLMPQDLRDVLFYVTYLGNIEGWERIQEEARLRNVRLDFPPDGFTTPTSPYRRGSGTGRTTSPSSKTRTRARNSTAVPPSSTSSRRAICAATSDYVRSAHGRARQHARGPLRRRRARP